MTETTAIHQAGGISIHAVDVARGVPAAGLEVWLSRLDPEAGEIASGCCQTNANQSLLGPNGSPLRRAELAPLGKSSGAVAFEIVA